MHEYAISALFAIVIEGSGIYSFTGVKYLFICSSVNSSFKQTIISTNDLGIPISQFHQLSNPENILSFLLV